MRKEELCAVLSVQKTASALQDLTEKVQLSAGEISNLSNKLDDNRLISSAIAALKGQFVGHCYHSIVFSKGPQTFFGNFLG